MTTTTPICPASEFDGAMMEDVERGGLWLRVAAFDNFGETVDRYTVLVEQELPWRDGENYEPETWSFFASEHPTSPVGVGMTDEGGAIDESEGNYLVDFGDLPQEVRDAVWRTAAHGWLLGTPNGSALLSYDFDRQRWYIDRFLGGQE